MADISRHSGENQEEDELERSIEDDERSDEESRPKKIYQEREVFIFFSISRK